MSKEILVNVVKCARCGEDHEEKCFFPLNNPQDDWTYYSKCPNNGQPILLKIITDPELSSGEAEVN